MMLARMHGSHHVFEWSLAPQIVQRDILVEVVARVFVVPLVFARTRIEVAKTHPEVFCRVFVFENRALEDVGELLLAVFGTCLDALLAGETVRGVRPEVESDDVESLAGPLCLLVPQDHRCMLMYGVL